MRYLATHITRYRYQEPASQCLSEARITPRATERQRVIETRIRVHPEPAQLIERDDYFGNHVAAFSVFRPHTEMTTTAQSVVEVNARAAEDEPSRVSCEAAREAARQGAAYEFTFDSPYVAASPGLRAYGEKLLAPARPLREAAAELMARIHSEFEYKPKATSIDMPLEEVFGKRRGVCQDFAHVMIGVLRSHRLAARYVSGYLRSGANLQGAEASHAWVSVFIPGEDWVDFDPTNNTIPGEGHVTVAWGRDFGDVTPIKGISLGGGKHTVEVAVTVRPL